MRSTTNSKPIFPNSSYSNITRSLTQEINTDIEENTLSAYNSRTRNQLLTEYYINKILSECALDLTQDLNLSSDTIQTQLKKEFNVFVAAIKLTNYTIVALSNNSDWIYDSGPFRLNYGLAKDPLAILHSELEENHVSGESLDALLLKLDKVIDKRLDVLKKIYIRKNKFSEFNHDINAIAVEAKELGCHLLLSTSTFNQEELNCHLSSLCSLNTYYLVRAICKKATSQVNVSSLLPKALRALNFETIKTLVELGADVNQNILLFLNSDENIKIEGPILLYPFATLAIDPQGLYFLDVCRFSAMYFRIDHPKLLNIMTYLLEHGANPEQQVLFKKCRENVKQESGTSSTLLKELTIKQFAHLLLTDENLNQVTPQFLDFLNKLANCTSDTRFQHQQPTAENVEAFKTFVFKQVELQQIEHLAEEDDVQDLEAGQRTSCKFG